jgi:hypothetical protein
MIAAQAPAPEPAVRAAPAQPPATGSITGHIFLGDSHLPARMATVLLLPVRRGDADDAKAVVTHATVQTGLDGSFTIPKVIPGTYYVVADKLGYAPPASLSRDDLEGYEHAPKIATDAFAAALTPVIVAANRITAVDVTLNKGAAISGTVRFDDGEPDTQTEVWLLRRDGSGMWAPFAVQKVWLFTTGAITDDQGNFRLAGLPAGEYLLGTSLGTELIKANNGGSDQSEGGYYSLGIYFGDGMRQRDAKVIKLKDGEESNGDNITIPLAKLHSVSGTVISIATGATVNTAQVELHYADDDSLAAEAGTSGDRDEFNFLYVPGGDYTLKVTHASDVTDAANICPGCTHRPEDEKTIRTYADASQPILVKGEMNGVTIQVKPQPPPAIAAAQ